MVNLKKNNFQYTFSVNGGDPKASIWGLILPFIVLTIGGGLYYTYANLWVPQEWLTYGWGVLAVTTLIFIISFLRRLSTGSFSRFVVKIDLELAQISAFDRLKTQSLWTTSFYPEQLYISEILLEVNGEEYSFPVLVYAEEHFELVEEAVPYPDRSILGYAEKEEIEQVLQEIHADIEKLYS
tara:strand:- start:77 stop:622 length:546 start_codon:yes stop_codon:yes gene_type:complete